MNRPHDVRPGERQQIAVAADVAGVIPEAPAAKVRLGQAVALDQRPGGAVQDEDAFAQQTGQQGNPLVSSADGRPRRGRGRRRRGPGTGLSWD